MIAPEKSQEQPKRNDRKKNEDKGSKQDRHARTRCDSRPGKHLFLSFRSKTQHFDENGTKCKIFRRVLDITMRQMRWRDASLTDWKWTPGGELEMQSGNGKFDWRQKAVTHGKWTSGEALS